MSNQFINVRSLFWVVFPLSLLMLAPPSFADDTSDAFVLKLHTKNIKVASNGQNYTQTNAGTPLALVISADANIKADAGNVGRVKNWSLWLNILSQSAIFNNQGFYQRFDSYKFFKSYPSGHRPRTVNRTERLSIPESAYADLFVSHCNMLANQLRTQGLSNKQIFAENRSIIYRIAASTDVSFTWGIVGGGFNSGGSWEIGQNLNVVCEKWQGSQIPTAGQGGLVAKETVYVVTDSSLTVLPQSTKGGACNVTLSGVIKTLKPNAPVRFKYRHQDGHTGIVKDSQIYEVTTDHSKTAMFSHIFDIKNLDGQDEHGTIKMVGISPEFNTKKKLYELACSTPSPSGLTTNLGPEASAYYVIQERAQVGNQSCPVKVRLVGTVKTHGARRGKAIFIGNQYLSSAFTFDLAENSQQQFIADRTINWDLNTGTQQGASHFAHGNTGGQALRFKDIRFGFNVATVPVQNTPTTGGLATPVAEGDYTSAASTPQQNIRLQCEPLAEDQQHLSLSLNSAQQSASVPIENATVGGIRSEQLSNRDKSASKTLKPNETTKKGLLLPAVQAAEAPRQPQHSTSASLQSNAKADLVVRALNIASNTFNKVGMTTLNARDAIRYENGVCLFDLTYSIENKGQVNSAPFKYHLTQGGILINQHQNIVLKSGEFDSFYKTIGLKTGMNTLRLDVDPNKKVVESHENNNHLVKQYNVIGRCDGAKPLGLKTKVNTTGSNNKPRIQAVPKTMKIERAR